MRIAKNCVIHIGSQALDVNTNTQADCNNLVNAIVLAIPNCTHIAFSTYLDYTTQISQWATAIHNTGKKIWFRSSGYNDWQGTNSVTQYTSSDFDTHSATQYQSFVNSNFSIFQAGDIFECIPDEPENNTQWNNWYGSLGSGLLGIVSIATPGTGYTVNDIVNVTGGASNAQIKITAVSSGVPTAISIQARGTFYTSGTLATTGGTGSGLTISNTIGQDAYNTFITNGLTQINAALASNGVIGVLTGYVHTNPSGSKDVITSTAANKLSALSTDDYPEGSNTTEQQCSDAMASEISTWINPATSRPRHITFGPNVNVQLSQQVQYDALRLEASVIRNKVTPSLDGITIYQVGNTSNTPLSRIFDYSGGVWTPRSVTSMINAIFDPGAVYFVGRNAQQPTILRDVMLI